MGDQYPSGWFLGPDIKRDNVIIWTLWALFSADTYEPEWKDEIEGYLAEIEGLLGRKLEDGHNDKAPSMRLTFDPVIALHRPVVWYLVSLLLPFNWFIYLFSIDCRRS